MQRGRQMFDLQIDAAEFERKVEDMGAAFDQMPYALSLALNDAAFDTRRKLVDDTWPQHVTVRNSGFIGYALRVEKSDKYNLRVAVYDQSNGSTHLRLHAEGGTKTARSNFAIPTPAVKLTAHGVRASQRPRALANSFRIGNSIYQRKGRGKNKKLVRMFTLAPTVRQPADVPFQQDFETAMRTSVALHFPDRMMQAMRTRR